MRPSRWFPVAAVVLVLTAAPPGPAQDLPDEATRARVADWIDQCGRVVSDACTPVVRRIEESKLGPWCLALDVYWDTARLVRDPDTILHFIEELMGRREKAREFIQECVPMIATALDEAGGDDDVPRDTGQRWEVARADRVMQAAKRSNLRSGPGIGHDKVGLLEVGDEVRVTGEVGDWLRIEAPGGGAAFIYGPLLAAAAPDRVATRSGGELAPSSDTVAETEAIAAQDIPDAATRERVADWMERCEGWSPDAALVCEPVTGQIGESAYGRWCLAIKDNIPGLWGDDALQVLRDPERALNAITERDDRRRKAEEFLRDCVPIYAAALDKAGEEVRPSTSSGVAAAPGPLHGSIAFSQHDDSGYAWGIAWSFDSAAGAQSEALGQCREYGGTQCAQAGWFQDACGALAIGGDNGYGTGWGDTIAEAERDALTWCRAQNENCRIEVARCSQSEEAGGRGHRPKEDRVAESPPEQVGPCRIFLEDLTEEQFGAVFFTPLPEEYFRYLERDYTRRADWTGPCADGLATGEGEAAFEYTWHYPPDRRKSIYRGHARNGRFHGPGWFKTWNDYGTPDVHETGILEGKWREGVLYEGTHISLRYCETTAIRQGESVAKEEGKC